MGKRASANEIIEGQLDDRLKGLERLLDADAMAFVGPIILGVDDEIRDAIEAKGARHAKLALILETAGGYIEVAERIVDTCRHHYKEVEFLVPNYAMSAGTVLVMSGDAIHMDYYSVLGPIDPQVVRPDGKSVPALGYLAQYEELIEKDRQGKLTTAEAQILIACFDQAELHYYKQARELTLTLLKRWLAEYKFKDWRQTETRKIAVTPGMRKERAKEIAVALNDTKSWHSHGRGICMEVLRRDLKLKIEDFGANPDLNRELRSYYRLLHDYMSRRGHSAIVHTPTRYQPIFREE